MNSTQHFEKSTKVLIDDLKSVCANYGLGNDGNEFKIITQVFLYKFMNDKFVHQLSQLKRFKGVPDLDQSIAKLSDQEFNEIAELEIDVKVAIVRPTEMISHLYQLQNENNFADIFDNTLQSIAENNIELFSVKTDGGQKIALFDKLSRYVTDKRDDFCRAIVNKLVPFSFENIFEEKFDFYATIFEYLIKDYNTNSGGKYAEYFTPHAVAKIMARCLVKEGVQNVTCYDPSAGSGTLLMNLAHEIGEDKCTIYSQDISQKSSNLLRLNLILNDLVHSIENIVKGNTILEPSHKDKKNGDPFKFDYIVSNPPFKLDFSDYRDHLDSKENNERFFAGIPNVPKTKKESMAIYLLFLQHIMYSLKGNGKAAIVVPTGFITAQSGIDKKIRERLVKNKMLAGVVSMPSNIFATTGTNVSVLFLDKENKGDVVLIDASNLGETVKEGKNQKTVLTFEEEEKIIETFNKKEAIDDFSVVVSYDEIEAKNYSLSAGQYFEVKIEYSDISSSTFDKMIDDYEESIDSLFKESEKLILEIRRNLKSLKYD